jgi:hypothetical protein
MDSAWPVILHNSSAARRPREDHESAVAVELF